MMTDDHTPIPSPDSTADDNLSGSLDISTDATPEEVAAITAAIGAHLRRERVAALATADTGRSWDGDRFRFAGRLDRLSGRSARVPKTAPRDEWTAAGRRDRFDR
jgi:hypothetical protein